jgi:hypothetical protein
MYSSIVAIKQSALAGAYFVYPNPVRGMTSVLFNAAVAGKYTMQVIDPLGRPLQVLDGVSVAGANKVDVDMGGYGGGIYTIVISDPVTGRRSLRVIKE